MQFQKSLLTATLLVAASLTAVSANAAPNPATSNFDVKITVNSICTFSTTPIADIQFDAVDAGTATAQVKNTDITINCSKGAAYNIALTPASTTSAVGVGNMKGPNDPEGLELIGYKLTKDAGGTTAWGNDGTDRVSGTGVLYATDITKTVYATLTDTADVTPGDYIDTVNVAVTY